MGLTLRPCKKDSRGVQQACCAEDQELPEEHGQVGQALSANDCFPPAASSNSSCSEVCLKPEETRERIKTKDQRQVKKISGSAG